MIFINPKTDFAFKKIFGSAESKDILISFLNATLYEEKPYIIDLEILNPYIAPKIRGMKDTYLDVKARLHNDTTVIIEMQVLNIEGFEKRILYNAAKAYSIQLDTGHKYTLLNPVIALTITDFIMFDNIDKITTRFILKEKDYLFDYTIYDLELVFIELPKFTKKLDELDTLHDKWLYFIKNAPELTAVPANMQTIPELEKAFKIAQQSNLTREELDDLEKREFFIQDQRNAIIKAKKEAKKQDSQEIAKKLRDILDIDKVSEVTGLSIEEIEAL